MNSPKVSNGAPSSVATSSQAPTDEALDLTVPASISISNPITSSDLNLVDTRPPALDPFTVDSELMLPCLSGDFVGEALGVDDLDTNVVPTFSEDDEEDDCVSKHLQLAL
ncbi:hypothetical protein Ciccas_005920 [Cichlidogyrus casuarinus]|uniref:Uncharacterized protein n=1 Tax=Cichlidogyrus casuarinus TaxID=1844966 RepID=A0ABD2Q9P3_9PLAT